MPLSPVSLGKFLKSELTEYDSQWYTPAEVDYWAARGDFIPSSDNMPLGAESIASFQKQNIGKAGVWNGKSKDIKLVNYVVSTSERPTVVFIDGAEWSFLDIERNIMAQRAGRSPRFSLIQGYMEALRDGLNRSIHETVLVGIPGSNFQGMLNNTTIPTVNETATTVLQFTPIELEEWFRGITAAFKKTSKLPYQSIQAWVSDNLWVKLTASITENVSETPLIRLTQPGRGISLGGIAPITELDEDQLEALGVYAANSNRERIIMGDLNNPASIMRSYYPMERTEAFQKDTGVHFGLTAWAGTSEAIFKSPEKFQIVEYSAVTV